MSFTKPHKVNVTGYLNTVVIDTLDELAKTLKVSRNSLLEEAILDFFDKKKDIIKELNI